MRFTVKTGLIVTAVATLFSSAGAFSQSVPSWVDGKKIKSIYADPSDVVLELNGNGPCGSSLFHIRRSTTNFQELTALMYTAAATGKDVNLYVAGCEGTRNIVGHGAAQF